MNHPRWSRIGLLVLASLSIGVALGLCGCASQTNTASATSPSSAASTGNVSTLPWNRPESWESAGPLGSYLGGMGAPGAMR
jgi:hypothetical protein